MYVRASLLILALAAMAPFAVSQVSIPTSTSEGVVDPLGSGMLRPGRSAMDSIASVSGLVINIAGKPIPKALVQLRQIENGTVVATAQSSRMGAFEFSNVPTGEYEVVAHLGVDEAHDRVRCAHSDTQVTLRINVATDDPSGGDTVSVKALRIPDAARAALRKAREAFQKSRFQDAWNHTAKALAAVPTYAEALTLRGLLRIHNGDTKGGEQDLAASIKDDSNYALAYFAMGAAQNLDGRFDDAERTLEQGLKIDPTSWQGYFELSKAMMGKSDYRSALKYAVKAEDFENNYAPIHLVKAHALLGLKIYDEAATELERYLQLDPKGPQSETARQALNQAKTFTTAGSE